MTKEDSLSLIRFICQDYFKMHKFSVNDIYEKYLESDSISDLVSYIKGIKIEQIERDILSDSLNYKPHLHKIFNPTSKNIMYAFDCSDLISLKLSRYQDGRLSHTFYIQYDLKRVFLMNEKEQECMLEFQTEHHLISLLSELNISPKEHIIADVTHPEDHFKKMSYFELKLKLKLWHEKR